MPHIICKLDNASEEISGVKFFPLEGVGVISEEVDQDTADFFLEIEGYELATDDQAPTAPTPKSIVQPPVKKAPAEAKKKVEAPAAEVKPAPTVGEEEVF